MSRCVLLLSLLLGLPAAAQAKPSFALFAGGCFWCMEAAYQGREGVIDVVSGYSGGTLDNPTYEQHADHLEVIQVTYEPERISYQALLDLYWVNIDPFDDHGQFCDKGQQYRSVIFAGSDDELALARASKSAVAERFPDQEVYTEVRQATQFWPAEQAHQDYYLKNPLRYKFYRWNCGRDQRLQQIWGDQAQH